MADHFQYDVFLSHNAKDKAVVRAVAERLRQDGLKVWFDEWEIKPGDSIPAKIEEGLEHSRVLVLCMSANAFGSDWAQLEAGTFRFRDPLSQDRRFIPLRLDDAPIRGSLAQFLYVNWLPANREQEYAKILEACRHTDSSVGGLAQATATPSLKGHTACILKVVVTADGKRAITASVDGSLRVWDLRSKSCLRKLEGHTGKVYDVALLPGDKQAVSCSSDTTLRVWDLVSGECIGVLKGHEGSVEAVTVTKDGSRALSGSADRTLRVWNLKAKTCTQILRGHTFPVRGVAVSEDGTSAFLSRVQIFFVAGIWIEGRHSSPSRGTVTGLTA